MYLYMYIVWRRKKGRAIYTLQNHTLPELNQTISNFLYMHAWQLSLGLNQNIVGIGKEKKRKQGIEITSIIIIFFLLI